MVEEFYFNVVISVDDNLISSIVREVDMLLSPKIIREVYRLPNVGTLGYPYRGMSSPSNAQMKDLF